MSFSSVRFLPVFIVAAFTAGCISLGLGGGENPQAQYRLEDLSPKASPRTTPFEQRLLISTIPSESIGDTYSMAYTRAPQQRQFYQFASWAERPSSRVVQLLAARLQARDMFESVSQLGGGIGGGVVLNIGVNEFVHDVRTGTARVEVTAELIQRRGRALVERRQFAASAPVAEENAPAAAAALSRALTTVLDELVPWLERAAESLPPRNPPPPRDGRS